MDGRMEDGTLTHLPSKSRIGDDALAQLDQAAVVLFYHYFASSTTATTKTTTSSSSSETILESWWKDPKRSVKALYGHQRRVCEQLQLTGRILIAEEGINGTVAGKRERVEEYISRMKEYCHQGELLLVDVDSKEDRTTTKRKRHSHIGDHHYFFRRVDWKVSYVKSGRKSDNDPRPLFPDLKISIVKEIVSTGGLVDVHDIPVEAGTHLSPEEFHAILTAHASRENDGRVYNKSSNNNNQLPPIALIDVRNTFEHNIGHFVNPQTGEKALDPEMATFSSFDKFCQEHAEDLKDKQVLMYCTGE